MVSTMIFQHVAWLVCAAMLSQLGSFYQKNGARARMSKDVGSSLLDKLKVAEASLPAIETKKKGIFG